MDQSKPNNQSNDQPNDKPKDQLRNKKIRVYIAGDWLRPPVQLAEKFEQKGFEVPHKWWEDRVSHKENTDLMCKEIKECDWFVFDMRTDRYEKHKFGGSHLGCGVALAYEKTIKVIMPADVTKPLTALLTPYVVATEDDLFQVPSYESLLKK